MPQRVDMRKNQTEKGAFEALTTGDVARGELAQCHYTIAPPLKEMLFNHTGAKTHFDLKNADG